MVFGIENSQISLSNFVENLLPRRVCNNVETVASKIMRFLWMAFLSIGIPLTITWRVSKEFLMGNGESLFAEMSEKPAYVLDLGVWSIPIQKFKHLDQWEDLATVFFDAKIPLVLLGITLIYTIFKRSKISIV